MARTEVLGEVAPAGGRVPAWRGSGAIACALAAALGLWTALRPGHTGDESFSALLAREPLGTWWDVASHQELNGSTHAAILRAWAMGGDSDAWFRIPSVVAMVAAVAVVMALARRLTGSAHVALLAGVVLAVNPLAVRYSAEGRGYTLFLALSAASTLLLVRFLDDRRSGDIIWWGVLTALLLYTHLFTAFLLVAQALVVLAHPERRVLIRASWRGLAVVAVGALPAAWYLAVNETSNIDWIGEPGLRDSVELGRELVAGSSWALAVVIGVAVVGGLVAVLTTGRDGRGPAPAWLAIALVALAATGPVLSVAISQIQPIVTVKYLMGSLPALAILAALGLARLGPMTRAIALALVVVLGVTTAASTSRPEPQRVVDVLVAEGQPGDGVVFGRFSLRVAVEESVVTSDEVPGPTPVWPAGAWGELDLIVARQPNLDRALDAFVQSGATRVWVISTPNENGLGVRRSTLRTFGVEPVERYRVRGALVELLILPPPIG